jgi:hypothetical protein
VSNSNKTNSADLNNIKTGWILAILVGIGLIIVGFYFFNFNFHILKNEGWWKVFQNLSVDTGKWGTFGDYVGGILNPVIAAFAFYLIAKTYELQKRELEATRILLEVSTDAQKKQIKLAALTALLNSNLTRISLLESEKLSLLERELRNPRPKEAVDTRDYLRNVLNGGHSNHVKGRWDYIKDEINELIKKNIEL